MTTLSTAAFAEGAYIAVDAGNSTIKDVCANTGTVFTCSDSGTAVRVGGGMQITPNFGIEANYAKLGMSRISSNISATGFPTKNTTKKAPSYGFGAQYNLSEQIGIRAQYEKLGKTTDVAAVDYDLTMISAGLVLKF